MKQQNERSRAMVRKYVALIRKEDTTDYWVDIPDLPGCISAGKTEEEAKANFAGALKLHLEGLNKLGNELSVPRSREDVLAVEEDAYLSDYIVEI